MNLIPPTAKRAVKYEYWVRMLGAWALVAAAALGVGICLLIPTYILIDRQLEALMLEMPQLEEGGSAEVYRDARAALEHADMLAAQLDAQPATIPASEALAEIQRVQEADVTIERFTYTRGEEAGAGIVLSGSAASRGALVAFADALERSPLFTRAEVPVGDLARDANLPFTITITVTQVPL